MPSDRTAIKHFSWYLPLCGAVGALIVFLPELILGYDFGAFILGYFLLAPVILLVVLIVAALKVRRYSFEVLAMLITFAACGWGLFKSAYDVHTEIRWLFEARHYKAQVIAQPAASDGELRHVEWEGWGGPGVGDTSVYLVFDPNNSLESAAKTHASGKMSGVPCPVAEVRRFQSHWYAVKPYTETDWNQCSPSK